MRSSKAQIRRDDTGTPIRFEVALTKEFKGLSEASIAPPPITDDNATVRSPAIARECLTAVRATPRNTGVAMRQRRSSLRARDASFAFCVRLVHVNDATNDHADAAIWSRGAFKRRKAVME